MTVTTPTLSLTLYDGSAPDNTTTFLAFRAVQSGTALTSNMYRIDSAVAADRLRLTSLESLRGAILVSATFISANYYEATVSEITALNTNMTIILKLDIASAGTVTLNISGLGTKAVSKIDSTGAVVNIASDELMVGKNYLFRYDGTQWIWVSANSADQIHITGTVGHNVRIASDNTLEDAGVMTTLPENIAFTGDITPAQIISNQNDYTPTGLSTATTLRLNSDASRNITGLAGGADGRIIILANTGSFNIVLINQSASSVAGNRFILANSADITLITNQDVMLQYDSTSSRWRLIGGTGSGGGSSNRSWFGV
jgi:hypothetical protein